MATGTIKAEIVVATSFDGGWLILKAPDEVKGFLDGCFCEDNCFDQSDLPKEKGVYRLDCEIWWDDGYNFFERTDPDFRITVESCTKLLLVEADKTRKNNV